MDMIPAVPKIAPVFFMKSLRLFSSGAFALAMIISCFGLSIFKSPFRKILWLENKKGVRLRLYAVGRLCPLLLILRTAVDSLMVKAMQQSCQ
jgi:hypothetical protein